ncbi:MAG: hypothetical protein AAF846_19620 [Chloroflexota bacterium]
MSSDAEQLLKLQQMDLTQRDHKARLTEIERDLANHAPVKKAQANLQQAEEALKPLQTQLRDLELQVQSTIQKRERSQQQLYSGAISNPKELQDIEQNIESLQRRQADLEDKQLELMLEVETAQETRETAETHLETVMAQMASSNQDLLEEKETLESELVTLGTDRQKLTAALPADYFALYQDLQPKMGFRPIAQLTDEQACSICGVQQTSLHAQQIKQSDDLLRCSSCNRILIAI